MTNLLDRHLFRETALGLLVATTLQILVAVPPVSFQYCSAALASLEYQYMASELSFREGGKDVNSTDDRSPRRASRIDIKNGRGAVYVARHLTANVF